MSLAAAKAGLEAAILASYTQTGKQHTPQQAAQEIADAVDAYVNAAFAEVTIPAATYAVEIPIGAVSVGASPSVIVNVAPIPLTLNSSSLKISGDKDAGTGGLS